MVLTPRTRIGQPCVHGNGYCQVGPETDHPAAQSKHKQRELFPDIYTLELCFNFLGENLLFKQRKIGCFPSDHSVT